ncbi:helix-turn-helix domain-containing protein [Bacillus cereus]|uniref:helix-turn-helix domain-containing protein n=1 Tax=Bacillus cereus group TaxID=86661 RepID=UPI0010BCF906|nr:MULTISPECIES: helix-turn-helix transcriptional regulator [Bacillus cereus group]MED1406015.1 helix-turn-helix transcriptional regulator [Bacillus mycoides]TKH12640.1 helix-turn-helix transcriptional regulator [Bacillus wiedmannii]
MNTFGQNLKKLRGMRAMSRKDLANELDIPYVTLTTWESGSRIPNSDKLVPIANFFGVSVSDLVEKTINNVEILDMYHKSNGDCEDPIKRLTTALYEKYKSVPDQYKAEIEKEILRYADLLKLDIDQKNKDNESAPS